MKTVEFEGTLEEWTALIKEKFPEAFIESNGTHRYAVTKEDLAHYSTIHGGGWIKQE